MCSTHCWTKNYVGGIWTGRSALLKVWNLLKACWKRVESNLNWFQLSFNIDSTFPLLLQMMNGVETVLIPRSTIVQHFVEWMLKTLHTWSVWIKTEQTNLLKIYVCDENKKRDWSFYHILTSSVCYQGTHTKRNLIYLFFTLLWNRLTHTKLELFSKIVIVLICVEIERANVLFIMSLVIKRKRALLLANARLTRYEIGYI